jgi:hypothetical protein
VERVVVVAVAAVAVVVGDVDVDVEDWAVVAGDWMAVALLSPPCAWRRDWDCGRRCVCAVGVQGAHLLCPCDPGSSTSTSTSTSTASATATATCAQDAFRV